MRVGVRIAVGKLYEEILALLHKDGIVGKIGTGSTVTTSSNVGGYYTHYIVRFVDMSNITNYMV